jgi:hypothetical protein
MMNDPRKILKAAGVEADTVNTFCKVYENLAQGRGFNPSLGLGEAAISDLVKMVARYKWMSEHYLTHELHNREYKNFAKAYSYQEIYELSEYYDDKVAEDGEEQ